MEREDAGVDTEQRSPAQHFHIPILEVEGVMRCHSRGVDWGFIVRGVRDGKIRETGNAHGRRSGSWSYGDYVYFWDGDQIG